MNTFETAEEAERVATVESPDTVPADQTEPVEQSTPIKFDPADVAQGIKLGAALKSNKIEIGELADRVASNHGDISLKKFAKIIGVPYASLKRYRSTYRQWKGVDFAGRRLPYPGVLAALAGHPKRDWIIEQHPKLTVREARTFAKDYRLAHPTASVSKSIEPGQPTPNPLRRGHHPASRS